MLLWMRPWSGCFCVLLAVSLASPWSWKGCQSSLSLFLSFYSLCWFIYFCSRGITSLSHLPSSPCNLAPCFRPFIFAFSSGRPCLFIDVLTPLLMSTEITSKFYSALYSSISLASPSNHSEIYSSAFGAQTSRVQLALQLRLECSGPTLFCTHLQLRWSPETSSRSARVSSHVLHET